MNYARLVRVDVKEGKAGSLSDFYSSTVLPALHQAAGCRYAGLAQSADRATRCISLTLWDSQEDARRYEIQGSYRKIMDEMRGILSDSTEFTIRLSEDLTLEYVPVPSDPVVSVYPIAASGKSRYDEGRDVPVWLRIVSFKVLPDKHEAFKRFYVEKVVPTLRRVKGCRHVYLLEDETGLNEFLSVTSWSSRQEAEVYENGGLFEELIRNQLPMLSGLYQWKKTFDKKGTQKAVTSEDIMIEHYYVLVGKSFV